MKRSLLAALLLLPVCLVAQDMPLHHRVKVFTHQVPGGLKGLAELGLAVDHGEVKQGRHLITDLSDAELELLTLHGHAYEVLINDVAAHYATQVPSSDRGGAVDQCGGGLNYPVPANFQLGSMGGFFTWQDMLDQLDAMRAQYPQLISAKEPIGESLEGRPIHFVRMSNAPEVEQGKPELFYNALHHSREPASLSQLLFFMWHLLEGHGTDAEATYLLDHFELYFVPCINPDGYVHNELIAPNGGGMWRKNRRDNGDGSFGVDLNRNYGFGWGIDNVGSSPNGGSEVFRGSGPFSEPETQAIRDFCEQRQFRLTLNNHTFGNLLIYPWGYLPSTYTPDSAVFTNYGHLLTRENRYVYGTADQTVNYVVNGGSDDWMYGEQDSKPKIFAMTPEAGEGSDGFWPASDRIVDICRSSMPQNLNTAHLAGVFGVVTDASPGILGPGALAIPFTLLRLGQEAGTFTVSVEPLENVATVGAPVAFEDMALLELRSGSIDLEVAPGLADGSLVRLVLALHNGAYTYRDTLVKVYGSPQVVLADDGSDLANWQTNNWGTSNTVWFSPPSSITDSPFGDYPNNADRRITLANPLDLTEATAARLSFMARWDIEQGYDHVQVQASTDNVNWVPLCGKYTRPGTAFQVEGEPVYDGRQPSWVQEEMSLDGFLGEHLRLRFRLVSDGWVTADGFYFDDLTVTVTTEGTTGITRAGAVASGMRVHPMPAAAYTWVTWTGDGPGPDRLVMHDALGRSVRTLPMNGLAGSLRVDLADLPAGTYLLHAERGEQRWPAQRVVVVRP